MESVASTVLEKLRHRSTPPIQCPAELEAKVSNTIQSFNTWAFKREQPSDPVLLARFVAQAVKLREPIPFVLYWGKGPRAEVANPDRECLDYLASFAARIKSVYDKGAHIRLVLTDTHAALNGHSAQETARYHGQITAEAHLRGFETYSLGELTSARIELVPAENCPPPSDTILQQLAASAARWYRGGGTPEQGARQYYMMNMMERQVIELSFPSSIFVTFNGREQRELFPEKLPIFYMYSLRRGTSVKPWFLPDPSTAPTPS
jgi:L-tyrosine isonitrile synthase